MNINNINDFKSYFDYSILQRNPKQNSNYLRKVEKNLETLGKIQAAADGSIPKLSFNNQTKEIELDYSYSITRGVRGFVNRNVWNYSSYNDELTNLKTFIKFTQQYFKSAGLPREKSAEIIEKLQRAQKGLKVLQQRYETEGNKDERIAIINKTNKILPQTARAIEANLRVLESPLDFLQDNLALLQEKTELTLERRFQKLKEKISTTPNLYEAVLDMKESTEDLERSEVHLEEKTKLKSNIADFKKIINRLDFLSLTKKESLLAEFLITDKNPEQVNDLIQVLTSTDRKHLDVSTKEKQKIQKLQASSLFDLTIAEQSSKVKSKKAYPLSRMPDLEKGMTHVVSFGGAAIMMYLGATYRPLGALAGLGKDMAVDTWQKLLSDEDQREPLVQDLGKVISEFKKNPAAFVEKINKLNKTKTEEGKQALETVNVTIEEATLVMKTLQDFFLADKTQNKAKPSESKVEDIQSDVEEDNTVGYDVIQ